MPQCSKTYIYIRTSVSLLSFFGQYLHFSADDKHVLLPCSRTLAPWVESTNCAVLCAVVAQIGNFQFARPSNIGPPFSLYGGSTAPLSSSVQLVTWRGKTLLSTNLVLGGGRPCFLPAWYLEGEDPVLSTNTSLALPLSLPWRIKGRRDSRERREWDIGTVRDAAQPSSILP